MTQRNGAAVEVHLLVHLILQTQILHTGQGLGGKRLVQLEQVDVTDGQTGPFERLLGRRHRAVTHDGGVAAGDGHGTNLGARREAEGLGTIRAHHQHGGGAIGQRRGAAGGDGAVDRVKHRAQLAQGFDRGLRADHLVIVVEEAGAAGVMAFQPDDLLGKTSFHGCRVGTAVGAGGKLVLLLTADAVQLAEHLGGQPHHAGGFRHRLGHAGVEVDAVAHRHVTHVLDAANDEDIPITYLNGARGIMQRLHTRAAQAVDGNRPHLLRNAGQQRGVAGDVEALLQGLLHAAPVDILDLVRVEVGVAQQDGFHQVRGQVFCTHVAEGAALGPAHRGPDTVDNDYVFHEWISFPQSVEGFALGSHLAQLVADAVERAQIGILVGHGHVAIQTNGVQIAEHAAAEGREAQTVDQRDVGFGWRGDNALFQTEHHLVDHRDHHAGDDSFLVEILFRLGDGGQQLVTGGVSHLLRLALLVLLVGVEALAVLLTEAVHFVHHVDGGATFLAHACREALRHHVTGMVTGIDADYVQQVGGAHRPAKLLLHHLVDGSEVGAIGDQLVEAEEVGEQHPVDEEARAVVDHHRGLAHRGGVGHHAVDGFIGCLLAADDLHQRHAVHRVEEVHAAEVLRALQSLGQQRDGDGGGVAGEHGVFADHAFHFTQYGGLHFRVLDHGFDHDVHAFDVVIAEGRSDGREHLAHLDAIDAALLELAVEQLGGFAHAKCQSLLVDILHHRRDTLAGRLVGDAAAHDAGTQYGGMASGLSSLFGRLLGQRLDVLIIQEDADQRLGDIGLGQLDKALCLNDQRFVTAHTCGGFDGFHRGHRRRIVFTRHGGNHAGGGGEAHHGFQFGEAQRRFLGGTTALPVQLARDGVLDHLQRSALQRVGGDHGIDGTHLEGVIGTVILAGGDPLERVVGADHPRQTDGAAKARHDAEFGLGQADFGGGVGQTEVGGENGLAAAAEGVALDSGEGGHRQIFDGVEDVVGLFQPAEQIFLRQIEQFQEFGNVGTDDKGVFAGGEDQTF